MKRSEVPNVDTDGEAPPVKKQKTPSTFLGRPLNKLDIDELRLDEDTMHATRGGPLGKLAALSLAIPTAQKSLRAQDQVARDEQGRRRFHGAFTGGFSAGYFNTVGTAEGWTPGSFQSSRQRREPAGTRRQNRVEDFMDEEDLANLGADALSVIQARHTQAPEDDDDEFTQLFEKRCYPTDFRVFHDTTRGYRMLRSMGWREGNFVLAPLLRRPPKNLGKELRRIGPQLPAELQRPNSSTEQEPETAYSDSYEEFWSERRRHILPKLITAARSLHGLKTDLYGVGYMHVPLAELAGIVSHQRNVSRVKATTGLQLIQGEGFGIGALEDEEVWDTVYDTADESRETKREAIARVQAADEQQSVVVSVQKKPWQRGDPVIFVKPVADHDLRAVDEPTKYLLRKYTAMAPPSDWLPSHTPSPAEAAAEEKILCGTGASGAIALLVEHVRRIKADRRSGHVSSEQQQHQQQEHPLASEADRRRLMLETPATTDRQKPLWSRVTDDAKKAMIAALISSSKFVKSSEQQHQLTESPEEKLNQCYSHDPEKQKRYELFCLALDEKISASVALKEASHLSAEEAAVERKEFGVSYREFRSRHPTVDILEHCLPTTRSLTQSATGSLMRQPSTAGTTYTRTSYNFKPDPLVCRRFGIRDPWEKKKFVNDAPATAGVVLEGESPGETVRRAESRSRAFVSGLVSLLEDTAPISNSVAERSSPTQQSQSTPTTAKPSDDVSNARLPRPPMSIFRAVFGDDEDADT